MNNPLDPTLRELNACACWTGTTAETPATIDNRPGLSAIAFRVGTQPQFKASLLAALSAAARPALAPLKTRDDDDFTIALLDGWATVADVLSFYSERIANESYLRTATERRSVLELARAIGYELKPGVAAATWLAFTVEDAPGAPGYANIPAGTKVQSIPGPDEKPQIYETLADFVARQEWNQWRAALLTQRLPRLDDTTIALAGVTTGLKEGDGLLIIGEERRKDAGSERWDFRLVRQLQTFPETDTKPAYTLVTFNRPLGWRGAGGYRRIPPADEEPVRVFALRQRAAIFGYNAPDWRALSPDIKAAYLSAANQTDSGKWPGFSILTPPSQAPGADTIDLDKVYPNIMTDDWVVVTDSDYEEVFRVVTVAEKSRTDFLLSAKTTRLKLEGEWAHLDSTAVRSATVFCQMEELLRAEPDHTPVRGTSVELDRLVSGVEAGRMLVVQGRRAHVRVLGRDGLALTDAAGAAWTAKADAILAAIDLPESLDRRTAVTRWQLEDATGRRGFAQAAPQDFEFVAAPDTAAGLVEAATFKAAKTTRDGKRTVLELTDPLANAYDPATVTILANVAYGTHGETVKDEILGGGDASQPNQRFELRQTPLTYVPDTSPAGAASTLQVWVNDVKWQEVPTLYDRDPGERIYITRLADDGTVTVEFGDGQSGARLPTGSGNLRAVYRKGIGLAGRVKAGQLSLLLTRPLGVKSVTNPQEPSEPADPQVLDDARRNAPRTVLTLGRVVSLQDYEDFARDFPGIAKAQATWTWSEHTRGVLLSVLGADGRVLAADDDTEKRLIAALLAAGNPLVPVLVLSAAPVAFTLRARITVAADRDPATVLAAVHDALRAEFAFDAREFGQAVALSEVTALMQNVPGVDSVAVAELKRPDTPAHPQPAPFLPAARPAPGVAAAEATAAELLLLDESSLDRVEIAPP